MIRDDPSRSELIRLGLAVRVDPVRLLYLPALGIKFCSWVAGNFMQVRKVKEATSIRIYTKSDWEQMSPIGSYFQLNSRDNFSTNRSVVDSNYCT